MTARDDNYPAEAGDGRCRAEAVVIGAGVSGCACAAVLAAAGVPVTVFNSSLDAVCHPAYGPLVAVQSGGWAQVAATLALLPRPVREAWLSCSEGVEEEAGFFCIDARRLSVEAKRVLEQMPGLQFRQGLIADLHVQRRVSDSGAGQTWGAAFPGHGGEWEVLVETAFGEVVRAAVVVVAVGLNLGGRIELGDSVLPGARYGETPGEGVLAALERLGVRLEETVLEVAPRVSGVASFEEGAASSGGPEVRCPGLCTSPAGDRAETEEPGSTLEPTEQVSESEVGRQMAKAQEAVTRLQPVGGHGAGRNLSSLTGERSWASLEPLAGILRAGGFLRDEQEWGGPASWSAEWPPSPYLEDPVRSEQRAVLLSRGPSESDRAGSSESGKRPKSKRPKSSAGSMPLVAPVLVPDGAATAEVHCVGGPGAFGECDRAVCEDPECRDYGVTSRKGYIVRGFVVKSLAHGGRLLTKGDDLLPVWVAGRAAGAAGYLESLASGARVGSAVAAYLREVGRGLFSSCDGFGRGRA